MKRTVILTEEQINTLTKTPITVLWLDDTREPNRYLSRIPHESCGVTFNNISFYDEFRKKYSPTFVWVKNFEEFVDYVENNGLPEFISFDYDLGKGLKKGALCAQWLKNYCQKKGLPIPKFYSHSANSHGRRKINSILSGNGSPINEDVRLDEWGRPVQYHDDDRLELIKDPNVRNGGNFPISRNGKEYWVSRSNSISLYVFCKDENGEWNVLASKRGPGAKFSPGLWNVVCGFLDYGYTLEGTAVKEAFEETGVKINKQTLKCLGTNSARTRGPVNTSFFCVMPRKTANYPTTISNSEPGEVTEARWIPLSLVDKFQWMSHQGEKAVGIFRNNVGFDSEKSGYEYINNVKENLLQMLKTSTISEKAYNHIIEILDTEIKTGVR